MNTETTTHAKFRTRVYCMNHTDGWVENATATDAIKWLESEESKCREFAQQAIANKTVQFDTEEEAEAWVNDSRDENGNEPPSDEAVFAPQAEVWIVDEDGDGTWDEINVRDIE